MGKILIKAILWSLIAAVTLELCARLDDWATYGAPLLGNYDNSNLNAFDAIGNRGKPNAHYLKWKLNSLGFRGPELDPNLPKLMCVGSSETFGQTEPEGMEWPRQVERLLKGVQVVNTGFAGETFPTSVKRLPERLATVKPVAVLLYPSVAHYLSVPYVHYAGPPPPPRPVPRMLSRLETVFKQVVPLKLMTYLRQRQIARDAPAYGPLLDNIPPDLAARFEKDLQTAARLIREAGAQPIFITHANRFGKTVTPEERFMLISWRRFYPNLREEGFLPMETTMNNIIRHVAMDEGAPLIDAAPEMPRGPRYFSDFVHFTAEGATIFSRFVRSLIFCFEFVFSISRRIFSASVGRSMCPSSFLIASAPMSASKSAP